MTERLRRFDDDALGRALAAAVRQIDWPAPPDVSGRVAETLRDQQRVPSLARPRLSLPRRRRTVLLIVVAVVLLALAAVAAKVVIDLGALTIDTIPGRPTALPSAVASGPTLGHPATMPDAEREAGFTARVPDALGAPDAVWVDETPDGARIVLGWKPRVTLPAIDDLPWGAVLYEFHGDAALASKLLVHGCEHDPAGRGWRTRRVVDHRPARARPGDGGRHVRPLPGRRQRARVEERRRRHAPRDGPEPSIGDPGRREPPPDPRGSGTEGTSSETAV